ncbi:MAG: hypothetical protein ACP5U1_00725 [Desulfomonilaceae bacterium]
MKIPIKAMVRERRKLGVYTIRYGKVLWKEISLGLRGIEEVEVTEGLSKGDIIITGPSPSQLKNGQRVYSK